MTRFKKVRKYRNRMARFQVPNSDTSGTKKVPNSSSGIGIGTDVVFGISVPHSMAGSTEIPKYRISFGITSSANN